MQSCIKPKWTWFSLFVTLVIFSNYLVYHLDIVQPYPKEMVFGSLFDFIIVIPLITYFFIIKNRYSVKYLLAVMIAGYGAAILIIPEGLLSSYSYLKYILFAGEGAFLLLELFIVYKLVTKLPAIIKTFHTSVTDIQAFPYRLENAFSNFLKPSRLLEILSSDITMFHYSLFSWRKKPFTSLNGSQVYSFHKRSGAIAFYVMIVHALVLESIGFHFLLHSWNPVAAFIALFLNIYSLLFLLAEIQAIRLCPFIITDKHLYLQIGITKRLVVPLNVIKTVHSYQGPETLSKEEQKHVLDAVLADFVKEKPAIEIEFFRPQQANLIYGFKKQVMKVQLRPDDPQRFASGLQEKLTERHGL
ncbi:hypothetical protein [Mesobacillus harenae]|uniref:hypothetical protein n=1 Tax=Mesobacillus harenae TaxID=2213203 RepID=UPI0015810869|nr:hypothetical protein [Mesobacillus harenae]